VADTLRPVPRTKRLAAPDRRAQILDAARRVFTQSGYAGARIKGISEEAGVNEALLYRHFASKEELYEAAIAEPLETVVKRLLELGVVAEERMASDAREYVIELVEEMLEALVEISPLLGVVLFGDQDRAAGFYRQHFAPAIDRLAEGLHSYWQEHGYEELPARMVIEMLMGAALLVSLDERFGADGAEHHDAVVAQIADMLLRMVEPPEGR
jgi:AcrR family transcriptional regulator